MIVKKNLVSTELNVSNPADFDSIFEEYMDDASAEEQDKIHNILCELSDKVRQGEHVQAMGEVSLEVAVSLFYFWSDHPRLSILFLG